MKEWGANKASFPLLPIIKYDCQEMKPKDFAHANQG